MAAPAEPGAKTIEGGGTKPHGVDYQQCRVQQQQRLDRHGVAGQRPAEKGRYADCKDDDHGYERPFRTSARKQRERAAGQA